MGKIDRDIQERDQKLAIGFSASSVLPGEDQKEFEGLLEELCRHYEPWVPPKTRRFKPWRRLSFASAISRFFSGHL